MRDAAILTTIHFTLNFHLLKIRMALISDRFLLNSRLLRSRSEESVTMNSAVRSPSGHGEWITHTFNKIQLH